MKPLGNVLQLNRLSCVSNKTSFYTVPPSTGPALFVNILNSLGEYAMDLTKFISSSK